MFRNQKMYSKCETYTSASAGSWLNEVSGNGQGEATGRVLVNKAANDHREIRRPVNAEDTVSKAWL